MRCFIWRLSVLRKRCSREIPRERRCDSGTLSFSQITRLTRRIECHWLCLSGLSRVVFGGEVTKLGGTYALLTPRIIGVFLLFGCIFTYLMNKTLPNISRVTHSSRKCNSLREKDSAARPLRPMKWCPFSYSLVYVGLDTCGCPQVYSKCGISRVTTCPWAGSHNTLWCTSFHGMPTA